MEKQNIKTYLQYFPKRPSPTPLRSKEHPFPSRKGQQSKLLPHIQQEFQYRITNHLLIKKIMSPKRDKIIMNSLESIKRRKPSSSKGKLVSQSHGRQIVTRSSDKKSRTEYRLKTAQNGVYHDSSFSSIDPYCRIASRHNSLTITKNEIQKETLDQTINQATKSSKMTKLIMRSLHEPRKAHRSEFFLPQTYGFGPTILCITHLEIITNPQLKADTLLQLELIQRASIEDQNQQQKLVRTSPIAYCELPHQNNPKYKVKFALKITKIGDFVPLRLWKYSGVDCSQLGTLDIPLSLYRLALSGGVSFMESDNVHWEGRNGSNLGRTAVTGEVSCQLRRGNLMEIQAKVVLRYKIYAKRFTKQKDFKTNIYQD